MYLLEEIFTFINMFMKFPMRIICKIKGHKLFFYGGGFLFSAKYSFVCKRCGIRSTGSFDDMKKKKLNPQGARIN